MSDAASVQPAAGGGSSRVHFVDWLRVLAMFSVFLFHNARFFDSISGWHVKNTTTDTTATLMVGFMSIWMMPLFFVLAGASTYYALKMRTTGQFIWERVLRLAVPFVFGILVIVVPQAYYEALFHGRLPDVPFLQLYPIYLAGLGGQQWYHLWFLVFLFIFSLVTLPLFIRWNKQGRSVMSRAASIFGNPWVLLLLPGLLLGVVDIVNSTSGFFGSRDSGGWSFVSYLLFYLFGYMVFANPRVMEIVRKRGWVALIIGAVAMVLIITAFWKVATNWQQYYGTLPFMIVQVLRGLSSWGWLVFILSLGALYLNRTNKFLAYASDAVLPFYILHQTVIVSVGFYVVQWDLPAGLKYLIISTSSFAIIMAIYELLIRRFNILRFLFGMRWRKKTSQAAS